MMTLSKTLFIVIFTLHFHFAESTTGGFECNYDEKRTWHVFGIYSACYNKPNRTELNKLAGDLDKTVRYMWDLKTSGLYGYSVNPTNITYISIDVCNDFDRLPQIVESIYLNETFQYKAWSRQFNKAYSFSTIIAMYAEGTSEMMNYLTASFDDDVRFTGKYTSSHHSVDREQFDIYASTLHGVITHHLKWERLLILNVQPSTTTLLYESLIQKSKQSKLCIQAKQVNSSWDIKREDFFTPKWFQENKPAVIIMGDKYGQVDIINQLAKLMNNHNVTIPILAEDFLNIMSKHYLAPDNFECFKAISSSFLTTEFGAFSKLERDMTKSEIELLQRISIITNRIMSMKQIYALVISLQFHEIYNSEYCQCPLDYDCMKFWTEHESKILLNNWDIAFYPFVDYHSVQAAFLNEYKPFDEDTFQQYVAGDNSYPCRQTENKRRYYHDTKSDRDHCRVEWEGEQCWWEGVAIVETSQCPILHCPPGFFKSYEQITNGYSWVCTSCALNHFKPDAGNHKCKPCIGRLSIDNGKRTACVDPYTNVYVDYSSKEFYIIGSISLLAMTFVMATLITFIINRNTPMVKTTDFRVSTIHMVIHAVTLLITPLVFFTNHACITKPLVFTTLYTLNIGIVFIKSQKLLRAFLSKVRITAGEAKRTVMNQIFTVLMFLLLVHTMFFTCQYQQPAIVLEFEDSLTLRREQLCNTYLHNTVVMIILAVIQLMCAIQAFRGRNLPNVMNDSIILMYTTFIMTASFVVCFIIVPFQQPIEKEISQCIALLVNTVVIMTLLYGKKAYRMLFHPEQNTRAYFRNQGMKKMKQKVNQRIEMR